LLLLKYAVEKDNARLQVVGDSKFIMDWANGRSHRKSGA